MDLIERYLQAIGRALPRKQRADILSELRSALYDALEGGEQGDPDEETVVAAIKRMGPPEQVAASYYPAGQYLIGPALYPLFRLVLGIVFIAVLGAQLLALLVSFTLGKGTPVLLDAFWGIVDGLPVAFGLVVAVFWGLQRLEVRPQTGAAFDPHDLPALEADSEPVSRGNQIASILVNVMFLVILARFAQRGGFVWVDGRGFFENPVIDRYFPLIGLSVLAGIVLDIVVLWQGRWQVSTRIASVLVKLFSLGVLYLLIQGHNAWLAAAGLPGLFDGVSEIPDLVLAGSPLAGMVVFRAGLSITAVITAVGTVVALYRVLPSSMRPAKVPPARWISANH